MADDFSFCCPRCKIEPKRGKFLGAEIWHVDCLIEDLTEKANSGVPREEIEKTLKRLKDKTIEDKVGMAAGWPEYQPQKTQEELDAEYQAELDAAEATKAAEEAAASGDEEAAAAAALLVEEANQAVQDVAAQGSSIKAAAPTTLAPGIPSANYPPQAPSYGMPMQMPMSMPMPASVSTVTIKPAPTDPQVRKFALSAMDICLKNMPDDIAYGKLLFKIIKEFDWKKLDEDEEDEKEEEPKAIESVETEPQEETPVVAPIVKEPKEEKTGKEGKKKRKGKKK